MDTPDDSATPPTDSSVTVTRMSLRSGGWIGYNDDAVFIDRGGDDDRIRIDGDTITQIAIRTLSWDLAVMSLALVGVGGYVLLTRNPLVGVGFAAVGLASLYRTYSKRYALVIHVQNTPSPVAVHPQHPTECHETLVEHVGLVDRSASVN
jgi:hypothetical protein